MVDDGTQDYYQLLVDNPSEMLKLVDIDLLRSLLSDFTVATGLTANIVTTRGTSIFSRQDAKNNCMFCQLVREHDRARGLHRCVDVYEREGKCAADEGQARVFECPAGLVAWVMPIVVENVHIGSLICGQVLADEPDGAFFEKLRRLNAETFDDIEELAGAVAELQVISEEKMLASSKMLGVLANSIVRTVWEELRRKSDVAYQRGLLEQERGEREELERKLDAFTASSYYDALRGVEQSVQQGDYEALRSTLSVMRNEAIGNAADFISAQTRLYDLVFEMSHLAIEHGADPERCTRTTMAYCRAERFVTSLEGLGHIAADALEKIVVAMEESVGTRRPAVEAMSRYIDTNLESSFSVQDVADSVGLSPFYASRIFKEDTGYTIVDYATAARMNEARYLLAESDLHIGDIARKLGYADPSYFGRVFKKHEGMSPRGYRASR